MTRTITAAEFAAKNTPDPRVYQYAIHWAGSVQPDEGAPAEYYTFCTTSMDAVELMERLTLEGHDLLNGIGWSAISSRFQVFVDFSPIVEEEKEQQPTEAILA